MTVPCPSCGDLREVSKVQFWQITSLKGRSSGNCKSCAETGSHKNLGQKRPNNASENQKLAMRGNQWRKGIVDQQHIDELAIINKGNKYAYGIRGKAHHSWKGGLGTERHRAMGQSEYKAWRDAVFFRDNFTCQLCDQYNGYLHADHIKTWAEYPTLRYEVSNGRTLCRACHYYITFKRNITTTSRWGLTSQEK